jgi:hypothetical protein
MIIGLSASLPASLYHGLTVHGVPASAAHRVSGLSPVSTLFASLLGYNPIKALVGAHVLAQLPHAQQVALTGRSFFPSLIAAPFKSGLHAALDFAIALSLLASAASWTRGGKAPAKTPLFGVTPGLDHADGKIDLDHELDRASNGVGGRGGATDGGRSREPAAAGAPANAAANVAASASANSAANSEGMR